MLKGSNLKLFPFLDSTHIYTHLPVYVVATKDVLPDVETLCTVENTVPTWAKAFQLILLLQPTSAAAKGVFSFIKLF